MSKTKTPSAKQAILEVLRVEPQASIAQIAVSAGVGRSTAGKLLAQLESDGTARRTAGGRDGKRRLPDRFALASTQRPSASPEPATTGPVAKTSRPQQAEPATTIKPEQSTVPQGKIAAAKTGDDRLKPGELDGLVLAYLKEHADSAPHGPGAVARDLSKSSGAVQNCLVRLTKAKRVRQDNDKPRRYSLAASSRRAPASGVSSPAPAHDAAAA
jgi:hypothetical protein